jgi:antitoxin HicB
MEGTEMLAYPVKLTTDSNGTVLATVPDLPEAVTFGNDADEALTRAAEVIEDCLAEYVSRGFRIPVPSPAKRGMRLAAISPLAEMKIAVYRAMLDQRISKADLARRLRCHPPQVDRLLDLAHNSRIDQINAAFRAVGKRLVIEVVDAA